MLKLTNCSSIIFFIIFSTLNTYAIHYFPPDTINADTSKNLTIIYDTVKTEKIIYVYDTLVIYDTIIEYDTTYINNKSNFFIELYGSRNSTYRKINLNDDVNEIVKLKNETEIIKPAYSIGLGFGYHLKKFRLNSGLAYLEYHEIADYNFSNQTITPFNILEITDNSYWQVDIVDTFYQVIGTDTTQIIVADSSWIADIDSVNTTNYDTTTIKNNYGGVNKYKYIEIPVIIGIKIWQNKRFNIDFNTGMITGFLIKSSGKTILPPDGFTITEIEKTPIIKTNMYLYGGLKVRYFFNDNFSMTFSSGYRYMLNSLYDKKNTMSYRIDMMGIRVGVSYNL